MLNATLTILMILGIVFGGGAATVASAQSSMPDDALYPVKIWSEDARINLATTPQSQLQLVNQFTTRRMEEIRTMLQAGNIPAEPVMQRLENQLRFALQLAANLAPDEAKQALLQIQARLQNQQQALEQMQLQAGEPALEQARNRAQSMLQLSLGDCQTGIEDPLRLREQLHEREQNRNLQPSPSYSSEESNLVTDGNPWTTGTPTPLSGYGPGGGAQNPWTTGTPTPLSGYGPGDGGQNPWTTGTPTPLSGYGPGPNTGGTIQPGPINGDGAGNTQVPLTSEPGQPDGESGNSTPHPTTHPNGNGNQP